MNKQEAIRNAARAVKAHGFTFPADLEKQIAGLENPQYRVAVVGEFQVGKSTLINRVFLGDKPLLTEGRGSCTTAVATDIEYGSAPTLEVYDWEFDIPGDDTKVPPKPPQTSRTAETLTKTVPNPTEADVNDATASRSMEKRAELAKKRARVVVKIPNEVLRGFTVVDTPGLDDPNQELLLDTTWRIIPNADVALLVVPARMLGERSLALLRKDIMRTHGISRLMVLVSSKPSDGLDAEQRQDVLDTIKAQLASIGRDNIPVEMYCFDSSVEDIYNNVDDLKQLIKKFLDKNALPGREEKIVNLLRVELEKDLANIATKIVTVGKSDAERSALATKVEAEVARFKEKAERAFERFHDEVKTLHSDAEYEVGLAVDAVFAKFFGELSEKETVNEMKKVLERAPIMLKSDLKDKISIIGLKIKSEINLMVSRYGKDMEDAGHGWSLFLEGDLDINAGFVAKIPPIVWDVINVVLADILLPGGYIIATIGYLLGKDFFDPSTWVAKKMILSNVKSGLEETKPEVVCQIMKQVDAGIEKAFADVKTSMEASNKAQVVAIRSALVASPAESADRAALESAKADLESALAAL